MTVNSLPRDADIALPDRRDLVEEPDVAALRPSRVCTLLLVRFTASFLLRALFGKTYSLGTSPILSINAIHFSKESSLIACSIKQASSTATSASMPRPFSRNAER